MKDSRYIIGVDLGTTNSTIAYIDTEKGDKDSYKIEVFSIPQLVSEDKVLDLNTLPSFLYLPGAYDLPEKQAALPWGDEGQHIVGEFARLQGMKVPSHLVSSAKSWLCHNRVDREGKILPWGSDREVGKVSPVKTSALYLKHIRDAWNHTLSGGKDRNRFERQQVVITIPASFDESARELTSEAVKMAGIPRFTMLEEPQAAFYAWLASHEDDWQDFISEDQLILVFDMGGGTTDFNLITLKKEGERMGFQRVAVGDHLMLGGDNMDLALARNVEARIMGQEKRLDFQQWLSLAQQCRSAKESLLGDSHTQSATVSLLGKGRGVVGASLREEIHRDRVQQVIMEGFFRHVGIDEEAEKERHPGLKELGLPYVYDTAVIKHLSSFLRRHGKNRELPHSIDGKSGRAIVSPDILLFNGGVFKSEAISEQVVHVINDWFSDGEWNLSVLKHTDLDHAVSLGAAYYGQVIRGRGMRISGGSGRAYYIAAKVPAQSADGELRDPITVLCLLPKGTEEGEEVHLSQPEFQVMANSPVSFDLYSSSYRTGDRKGDIIIEERESFHRLPSIRTILHFGKKGESRRIPVSLGIRLNEFGTLDVWCESKETTHRWKLAFLIRSANDESQEQMQQREQESHTLDESTVDGSIGLIREGFQGSPKTPSGVMPENLMKHLEKELTLDKARWPLFAIRKMWDALITMKDRRKTTPRHEARWLNLSGFLLRPGFGYQLDDWRIRELWKLFPQGLSFPKDGQCRTEWWILWRRTAGGLSDMQQDIIFKKIAPSLLSKGKKRGTTRLSNAEVTEVWMLAASLEHLPGSAKAELGDELLRLIGKNKGKISGNLYWALSRLGARVPFHGPIDRVVPKEHVEGWISRLLEIGWSSPRTVMYAITQISRKTDDRTRDIDDSLRNEVIERFSSFEWAGHFTEQVSAVLPLEWEDEKSIFGESLPLGLYIEHTEKE